MVVIIFIIMFVPCIVISQKIPCSAAQARAALMVNSILLSKRFCRIPHRFFIMLNAHSSCTLAEENFLLKTISSSSLVLFRVRFHQPRTQRVRIVPNKVRGDFSTCHFYRIRRCGENFPLLYSAENRTSSQYPNIVHTSRRSRSEIRENFVSIDNSLYHEIVLLVSTEEVSCTAWWRFDPDMEAVNCAYNVR